VRRVGLCGRGGPCPCGSVGLRSSVLHVYDVVMGRVMDDDDAVPVPVLYLFCGVPVRACVRRRGYGGARRGTSECGWGLPTVMLIRLRVVVARTVQLKASRTAITVTDRQHQRFRSFIIIIDSFWDLVVEKDTTCTRAL